MQLRREARYSGISNVNLTCGSHIRSSHANLTYTVWFPIQISHDCRHEYGPRARVQTSMDIWHVDPHLQNLHYLAPAVASLKSETQFSVYLWKIITLFRNSCTLFEKNITLFRKSDTLFKKIITLFRKVALCLGTLLVCLRKVKILSLYLYLILIYAATACSTLQWDFQYRSHMQSSHEVATSCELHMWISHANLHIQYDFQ